MNFNFIKYLFCDAILSMCITGRAKMIDLQNELENISWNALATMFCNELMQIF